MSFKITSRAIDPAELKRSLETDSAGACVTFEGWVRDHNDGAAVLALEYEAHAAIAEQEGAKIVGEALERFAVTAARCEHRVGKLAIGDCAVWVGVTRRIAAPRSTRAATSSTRPSSVCRSGRKSTTATASRAG